MLADMKTLKILIRIDLGLLAFIAWSVTFGYSRSVKGVEGMVWFYTVDVTVV